MITKNPKDDPGDLCDAMKWDIPDTGLTPIKVGSYTYKVRSDSGLNKLLYIRSEIDRLCSCMLSTMDKQDASWKEPVKIFLYIHGSGNYLLHEIPDDVEFVGLNKPRMRYLSDEAPVGPDKSIRAKYREVYLKLHVSKKELYNLILHELSHTGCNHVNWRDDDHGSDFKAFENYLKYIAKNIKFLKDL